MLPYCAPPYGLFGMLGAILNRQQAVATETVEALFSERLGVREAIVLPSARAGIKWSLTATGASGMPVYCPVFTCSVVWEAVFRAGASLRGVDVGSGSFLMDERALSQAAAARYGLIACELFGHTYDLESLNRGLKAAPEICIVDLAGGLLRPELLQRLGERDVAVVSFGRGSKAMYCGWGGMAFTQNAGLAQAIRNLRHTETQRSSPSELWEHSLRLFLVRLLHTTTGCSIKHWLKRGMTEPDEPMSATAGRQFSLAPNWLERRLMAYNLDQIEHHIECRREWARRYHRNLSNLERLTLPPSTDDILSHYTVQVPAAWRQAVIAELKHAGIEVGQLFGFSTEMREYRRYFPANAQGSQFPNASRLGAEVINLPLHTNLRAGDIDRISDQLRQALGRRTLHAADVKEIQLAHCA